MQLQLVSPEFCRACRSIPTLHVSVEEETPQSLWVLKERQTQPRTRSSPKRSRLSSGVPAIRALRLTWVLPMEVLLQSTSRDLWEWWIFLLGSVGSAKFDSPCMGDVVPSGWNICPLDMISTSPSLELCGRPLCSSYRSGGASTSPSPELCGRPFCSSYRLEVPSTSPSQGLCGRLICNSCRLDTFSTSPSPGLCGRPV